MDNDVFRDHYAAQNDLAAFIHRLYFCFFDLRRVFAPQSMRSDHQPLKRSICLKIDADRLLGKDTRKHLCPGNLRILKPFCFHLDRIFRIWLLLRWLHAVLQRRRFDFQDRRLPGRIRPDLLDRLTTLPGIRDPDQCILHRPCSVCRHHCYFEPALINVLLLRPDISIRSHSFLLPKALRIVYATGA